MQSCFYSQLRFVNKRTQSTFSDVRMLQLSRRRAPIHALLACSYLCKSASVAELCIRPSQDSDRSYGLSRTLAERSRVDEEDNGDNGFGDCGDVGLGCCGDGKGDTLPAVAVMGSMTVVDDVVVGSLRRVDRRLINDVLCLKR